MPEAAARHIALFRAIDVGVRGTGRNWRTVEKIAARLGFRAGLSA